MHNSPYYHNVDRKGAIRFLENIPNLSDGAFLLRPSKKYLFVLTVYNKKRVYNIPVEKDADGHFFCQVEGMEIKFKTLEAFIEYYTLNGLIICDEENNFPHIRLNKLL